MRRGYHHGNLRETLIDEASKMLAELGGPLGFSLADAARAAGVSPAAPYRHFDSKEQLIVAIAQRGFGKFHKALAAARRAKDTPADQLLAMGTAYLEFARNHPGDYIAMFESRVAVREHPELAHLADAAISELRDAAETMVAALPADARPPASMVANHLWAMSHGIVELFMRSNESTMSPFEANALLEAGARLYFKGITETAK